MRNLNKLLCVLFVLLFSFQQVVAEVPELVRKAVDVMQASSKTDWAYTRTTSHDNSVTVERFDPSAEQKWTTLTINGKVVPSDFEHPQHADGEDDSDEDEDFLNIAQEDSWELVSETDTEATYHFTPKAKDAEEAKFLKHLQGSMLIDKQDLYVKKFSMKALRKFKPIAIAKVLNMYVEAEFADVGDNNYQVVKESEDVTVRIALIKKREKNLKTFSDYVRVE